MRKTLKIIYIILAFLFMGLGIIGIIIPVLPTTPFLLLSLFFFSKGSKKFEDWFVSTKLYKRYLEDFVKTREMSLKNKLQILIFATTLLLIAAYFVQVIYARIFIGLVILVKYYYFIFKIKTIKLVKENKKEIEAIKIKEEKLNC